MPHVFRPAAAAVALLAALPTLPALAEAPADTAVPGISAIAPLVPDAVSQAAAEADPAVRAFYAMRSDAPVWHDGEAWQPIAAAALAVLEDAYAHGLDPADYLPPMAEALLDARPTAHADVDLTAGVLRYLRDVAGGRIPPRDRPGHRYPHGLPDQPRAAAELLGDVLATPAPGAALAAVQPDHPQYARLKDTLAELRTRKAATGGWPRVPAGRSIRPGELDPRVPLVRASLMLHGDLMPEPGPRDAANETRHDPALVAALERFQERHGITVDGIVGPDTLKTMNVSIDERMTQIVANLERLRWDPAPPAVGKAVEVNLPDYRLTAYQDGLPVLTSRVVVGSRDNETPLFTDFMDNVVLNPTWTVPRSIAAEEILPQLRADPAYVFGRNMEVFASWSRSAPTVDPFEVDWWQVEGRSMPYRFVQSAGPHNALGQVRFSLNNDFAIYMHDTPSKSLFSRPHRAFSHGCVRVQEWDHLLRFVAGDRYDAMRGRLDSGRTMTVRLPEPVDARVVYHTAWVADDGTLNVRRDTYGNDTQVLQRLQEEGRQLIALKPQDPTEIPVER